MSGRPPSLYLGVDAGNSKTVAVAADEAGIVRGYGRGGCGDIYGAATESLAVAEVVAAVRRALAMVEQSTGQSADETAVVAAAFCLAGVDWASDEEYWREQLSLWLPGLDQPALLNDGFALLRAGEPDGEGVALSLGTGAAVVARGPQGAEWSASFWLVDSLGGHALGAQAYAAVVRAELGIAPPTMLREVVLSRHGFVDVAALLEATTRRGAGPVRHAQLARDVLDAAGTGDLVAVGIVQAQARLLAGYAKAAADQVQLVGPEIPVVLGGSVLSSENPVLREATRDSLTELVPAACPSLTPRSPVVGAVAEAIASRVGNPDPAVVNELTSYAFPPEFLLT